MALASTFVASSGDGYEIQMGRWSIRSTVQRDQLSRKLGKATLKVRIFSLDNKQLLLRLR